jgi:protein-tyrosine-phosphatase
MAEGLFRKMIADQPDLKVSSAGVSTYPGQSPSPHAVEVLARVGIDISGTRSKPLTERLVEEATWIVAMTRSHLDSIFYQYPEAAEKTYLLREFEPGAASFDIADPIGLGIDAYEEARDTIKNALPGLLEFITSERINEKLTSGIMNERAGNQSL